MGKPVRASFVRVIPSCNWVSIAISFRSFKIISDTLLSFQSLCLAGIHITQATTEANTAFAITQPKQLQHHSKLYQIHYFHLNHYVRILDCYKILNILFERTLKRKLDLSNLSSSSNHIKLPKLVLSPSSFFFFSFASHHFKILIKSTSGRQKSVWTSSSSTTKMRNVQNC